MSTCPRSVEPSVTMGPRAIARWDSAAAAAATSSAAASATAATNVTRRVATSDTNYLLWRVAGQPPLRSVRHAGFTNWLVRTHKRREAGSRPLVQLVSNRVRLRRHGRRRLALQLLAEQLL